MIVEKPVPNRRVSGQKPPVEKTLQTVMPPIDELTGEPMKTIKMPATWTPFNKRGNAAFIYIFFRNVSFLL